MRTSRAYAVNVMISRETIRRNHNRIIDEGAKRVVHARERDHIRRLLKEGAQARAARDLALAKEWSAS